MVAASELEQILLRLSMPDNQTIQQATLHLKTAFTSPNIVSALIEVLSASQNPIVRQYAAILLRRRIVKHWRRVAQDVKLGLKTALIQVLTVETEHLVKIATCQVISSIAKNEFKKEGWPEVMQFVGNAVQSQNIKQKEVGYLLLSCICDTSGEMLKPFYPELFPVFDKGLQNRTSKKSAFYAIKAVTSIVPYLGSDEEALVKPLIPKALDFVKELLQEDEEKACEAMDMFDELVEIEVGIIVPYVKSLVELCLQIVRCEDYGDTIRVKALYLLCWACRRKAKALLKSQLLGPLLEILLGLMSLAENNDSELSENGLSQDDDDEGEMEGSTLPSVAAQALDLLALHLPPAKFIPQVMIMIQNCLASANQFQRKAGYIALGVLAEGCADYIRNRHLQEALQTVSKGLTDESYLVRNAALFTLGQFAEHFQQDMNKFHSEIIPVLLLQMQNTLIGQDPKQKTTLTRIYYALESLCENLEKDDILPYLESLVGTFLSTIKSSKGIYATELAISAIGSLATSSKDALLPYFPTLMDHLKVFLEEPATLETSSLQAQAVDTLGSIARNIGSENFKYMAGECMELGMALLDDSDDPDIRRCTYALFSSLSTVLKTDMTKYLGQIIPKMIESLKSTEGIIAQFSEDEPAFLLDDELDVEDPADDDHDDDDDDDVEGYTVENAYLDEKEDTCNAISEIAEETRNSFLPYLEECFKEVYPFIEDANVSLKKASIMCCATLCSVLQNVLKENGATDFTPAMGLTSKTLAAALGMINKEHDQSCVMAAIDALNDILKSFRGIGLQNKEFTDLIANAAHNLLLEKTPCQQDGDDSYAEEDEESQAEMDAMLIEKTGDVLPSLAQAVGGAVFKDYFQGFLPLLVKRTRKTCAVSERSFSVGTLAEVIQAMEKYISPFTEQLSQLFLATMKDDDDEVVSNSIFALGVLAESSAEAAVPYYNSILEALSAVAKMTQAPLVMDNICGAISRLIMTNSNAVPVQQVLPVLIQQLPIKEDKSENETVMKCLCMVYGSASQILEPFIGQLTGHMLQALIKPDSGLTVGTKQSIKQVLADVKGRFPGDFESVMTTLGVSGHLFDDIS